MQQSVPASFFATKRPFHPAEYAAAAGLRPDDPAVEAMLDRHIRAGRVKHIAGDVFSTVREGRDPVRSRVDPFLMVDWLRPGAVLAYHSALDLHGCAYTATCCRIQAFVPDRAGELAADGYFYEFIEPAPGIVLGGGPPADGIETVTFMDVDVRVTTMERTLADIFARPWMCGDMLHESVDFAYECDGAALVRHVRALDDAAVAGAMGFWLESRREVRGADDATLRELRALAPREPRYALGAVPGKGLPAAGWNVILPDEFVEPTFEGQPWPEV